MKLGAFGILTILVVAAGCKPEPPVVVAPQVAETATYPQTPVGETVPQIDAPDPANGAAAPVVETAADQPTIKIASWEETQQLVAQNTGKVVILDLWASW